MGILGQPVLEIYFFRSLRCNERHQTTNATHHIRQKRRCGVSPKNLYDFVAILRVECSFDDCRQVPRFDRSTDTSPLDSARLDVVHEEATSGRQSPTISTSRNRPDRVRTVKTELVCTTNVAYCRFVMVNSPREKSTAVGAC